MINIELLVYIEESLKRQASALNDSSFNAYKTRINLQLYKLKDRWFRLATDWVSHHLALIEDLSSNSSQWYTLNKKQSGWVVLFGIIFKKLHLKWSLRWFKNALSDAWRFPQSEWQSHHIWKYVQSRVLHWSQLWVPQKAYYRFIWI